MTSRGRLVSIVIPCHNEETVLPELHRRLLAVANTVTEARFELIFVDDGSKDRTLEILREMAALDPNIRVIALSRNFGHQLAVTAGVDSAVGDAVVLIDADLQDPPELIPEMIHHWLSGYQVVYGVRNERRGESRFKIATAHIFYRLLNSLSDIPIPLDTGDFRLMDRAVADVLREMPERDRFIRGLVSWAGFRQMALPYKRDPRHSGTTKYPFRKMVRFAGDGIISFSVSPLKLASLVGTTCAGVASLGILWIIGGRLLTKNWVPGWTATIVAILFLGGIQLLCTGILGEYIGRIYMQSKKRPLYVVRETIQSPDRGNGQG
jgi:glycosyltransferase involved in cell wall biosynthesis